MGLGCLYGLCFFSGVTEILCFAKRFAMTNSARSNPGILKKEDSVSFSGVTEIRTRDTLLAYTRFPGVPLQPLEHHSFGFGRCKGSIKIRFMQCADVRCCLKSCGKFDQRPKKHGASASKRHQNNAGIRNATRRCRARRDCAPAGWLCRTRSRSTRS